MNSETKEHGAAAWLWQLTGRKKWYIVLLVGLQALIGLSGVASALLLRGLIDAAAAGEREGVLRAVLSLTALILSQIALRAASRYLEEYTRSVLENRLKQRLFEGLLKKDYAAITRLHSGEWVTRLTSDTVVAADGLAQIFPGAAGMAARMAGALAALLALEPGFVYILVPGGAFLIGLSWAFRRVLKRLHKKIQEADGALRTFFQERLGSLLIVRAFAGEKQTAARSLELMEAHKRTRMRRSCFSNLCNIGFSAAMNGAWVFGAVYCGYGILAGTVSYGTFTAVLQLISQIQNPFANITGYLPRYYAMLASAERLMEAEDLPEDCPGGSLPQEVLARFYREAFVGLGLRKVAFTYPALAGKGAQRVFSALDLEIRKGEYVAFVGPSGCGKSTVLKLLMCLYPLDGGERYLMASDGERPLTAACRGLFAYVPQGNQLMSGSVREIVAFGDPERMREEDRIHRALQIACADGFVAKLEQGLDTLLGERGAGLSEGQIERLAIARAVFSDHPILFLDEATGSLDEETERKLLVNLRAMTDRTVLLVTHRPGALSIVDRTVELFPERRGRNG